MCALVAVTIIKMRKTTGNQEPKEENVVGTIIVRAHKSHFSQPLNICEEKKIPKSFQEMATYVVNLCRNDDPK